MKIFKSAVNLGSNMAVGTLGTFIGSALYDVSKYVIFELFFKEEEVKDIRENDVVNNE